MYDHERAAIREKRIPKSSVILLNGSVTGVRHWLCSEGQEFPCRTILRTADGNLCAYGGEETNGYGTKITDKLDEVLNGFSPSMRNEVIDLLEGKLRSDQIRQKYPQYVIVGN